MLLEVLLMGKDDFMIIVLVELYYEDWRFSNRIIKWANCNISSHVASGVAK